MKFVEALVLIAITSGIAGLAAACGTGDTGYEECCKTCTEGKACGDSCINENTTCEEGPGCACDG